MSRYNQLETLETVLVGNVIQYASMNQQMRQLLARGVAMGQTAEQHLQQIEASIKQDIDGAKSQLPSFLKDLDIPAEIESKLHDLHVNSFYESVRTDAENTLRSLETHFKAALNIQPLTVVPPLPEQAAPPTPPPAPAS